MDNKYNDSLISVIIPVYNASDNLKKCLDSLSGQKYRNLELLFIDDCSTDDSAAVIQRFMKDPVNADLKIKFLQHSHNRGVAAARNTGLGYATGECIYYLDADDYIADNALQLMHDEMKQSNADIVGCEWFLSFSKNERYMVQPQVTNGKELFVKMCRGVMRWNLWLFLVRRSLYEVNDIRFTEGMNMGEDMMVMMRLALCSGKVSMLKIPLYHYIQTKTDSLTKNWAKAYFEEITANVQMVEDYLKVNYPDNRFAEELNFLKLNIKLPLLISFSTDDYRKWQKWFPEANHSIMNNMDIAFRTRMIQWIADKRQYWLLKLYNLLVVKVVYGIIYK